MTDQSGTPDTAALASLGLEVGAVVEGKYRIERVLAVGDRDVVVAAQHVHLTEPTAIKFLLPHAMYSAEAATRFAREARATAKIKSEHVARVMDVAQLGNGAPYIVMEYLDGTDMATGLRTYGPLPVWQAAEFILQACEAVAEAHSLGIIHRDLAPANLLVVQQRDGRYSVKVLNFGLSKLSDPAVAGPQVAVTQANTTLGTPYYTSPEQLMAPSQVDAATDIWSLGAVLFELVSGRVPFPAASMADLCMMVTQQAPPSLCELRPDVSPAFDAVVNRCLQRDRSQRYGSVAQLAADLATHAPEATRDYVQRICSLLGVAGGAVVAPTEPAPPLPDPGRQPAVPAAAPMQPGLEAGAPGAALEAPLPGDYGAAPPVAMEGAPQADWGPSEPVEWVPGMPKQRKGTGLFVALGALVLFGFVGVAAAGAWWWLNRGHSVALSQGDASAENVGNEAPVADSAAAAADSAAGEITGEQETDAVGATEAEAAASAVTIASASAEAEPAAPPAAHPAREPVSASPRPVTTRRPAAPSQPTSPSPRPAPPGGPRPGDLRGVGK